MIKIENFIKDLEFKIEQEVEAFKKLCTIPFKDDFWRKDLLKCKYRKHLLEELVVEYTNKLKQNEGENDYD